MDIKDKLIVIVGGGKVAYRKIEKLLPFEPRIKVVSSEICENISRLENVEIERRSFRDSDIDGTFAVIGATDDEALNAHISQLCREKNIMVNIVDDPEKCGFIFPALVKENDITVGITTSGKSPLFARFLRRQIEDIFDEQLIETAEILSRYRPIIKDRFNTEKQRKEASESLLELCLIGGKLPTDKEINDLLERIKNSYEN